MVKCDRLHKFLLNRALKIIQHQINHLLSSCGNVVEFICLGIMATNQNYIHEESKNRLRLGNAFTFHPRTFTFFSLCKNINIGMYMTIHFTVLLYGCDVILSL